MIEVRFFTGFAKRKNSTRRPANNYQTYNCNIKAPSSIITPTIEIAYNDNTGFNNFSYAYIPSFGRYYFIRDIRYMNRVWEIDLECDVLATYKDSIVGSRKYVLRSETDTDISIVDDLRLTRHHVSTDIKVVDCPWVAHAGVGIGWGSFVVGIIGTGGKTGVVRHYVFQADALSQFINAIYKVNLFNLDAQDTAILTANLLKAFCNPSQYVVSIMWFPFTAPYAEAVPIRLGWWDVEGSTDPTQFAGAVNPLAQYTHKFPQVFIEGNLHPQTENKEHFLNSSPYTTRSLFLPVFGEVPIDTERGSFQQFQVRTCVDFLTGAAQADILSAGNDTSETPAIVARVNGQLGVPLPVAQVAQNGGGMLDAWTSRQQATVGALGGFMQAFGGAGSAAGGAEQGSAGTIGAGIGNMSAGITNAGSSLIVHANAALHGIQASVPTATSSGAFGSFLETLNTEDAALKRQIMLSETFINVSETSPSEVGLPLAQNRNLSDISGFTICANGNIDVFGTKQEKDALELYLTTGFHIE